jgi:hypothetical protein
MHQEVQAQDFFYAREGTTERNGHDQLGSIPPLDSSESTAAESSSTILQDSSREESEERPRLETEEDVGGGDYDDDDDGDIEQAIPCEEDAIKCDQDDEEAHLYLRLPGCLLENGKHRCVDAHCAICLGEYEGKHIILIFFSISPLSTTYSFFSNIILTLFIF